MKRKIIPLILTLTIVIASAYPAFAYTLSARERDFCADRYQVVFNEGSGFPENTVYDVAQAPDGTLFFATENGLVEYTGLDNYTVYNRETVDGVGFTAVTTVFSDSLGRIWFGTNDAGLFLKTQDGFMSFNLSSGAPSNSVRDIAENSAAEIIIATANGIYSVDSQYNITVFDIASDISSQGYLLVHDPYAEGLVCITNTGFVARLSGSSIVETLSYSHITDSIIKDLDYVDASTYRVGTESGEVFEVTKSDAGESVKKLADTDGAVIKMIRDSNGLCWVLCKNGIGYIDGESVYHRVTGLQLSGITSVVCDFQGNYWFTSESGAVELCESTVQNLNYCYNLKDGTVNCVTEFDGLIYVGTQTGLSIINEAAGGTVENKLTETLDGISVSDMSASQDGLYIATSENGVFSYSGDGKIKHITTEDGLYDNRVNTVAVMSDGYVVAGFEDGVSIFNDEGVVKTYNEENGLAGKVLALQEIDSLDICIVGTESNGTYKIQQDGTVVSYNDNDALKDASGAVKSMYLSSGEGLWIGIGSDLYFSQADGNIVKIEKFDNKHDILDIEKSPDGRMWIVTADKIFITAEQELLDGSLELSALTLDKNDGLVSSIGSYSGNCMTDDGVLYLCTDSGLLSVDAEGFTGEAEATANLQIGGIHADDDSADLTGTEIADTVKKITVDVSVLSFMPYHEYNIKYSLSGSSSYEYTEQAGESNSFVFVNPSGGSYTLTVSVIDSETNEVLDTEQVSFTKTYSYLEQVFVRVVLGFIIVFILIALAGILFMIKSNREKKKRTKAQKINEQIMLAFTKIIDAKDAYTKGHSERVARYSDEIAKRYKVSRKRRENIYYAALLHDIGKIGIPDYILKKSDKLTPEEYETIKTHTTVGADILKEMTVVKNIQLGALEHHERYDGKGYPNGLKGNEISLEGKIIGAADAYDAMASARAYNDVYDSDYIKEEIINESGKQFDPKIAEILIKMIDDGYFDEQRDA